MEERNKIKVPDARGCDKETQKYFENVGRAEKLINSYFNDTNNGKILHDNCHWISIEDYVELYSKKSEEHADELFEVAADMKDSPLERALYLAATQGVLFEKEGQKFKVDYTMGVHSEYRNYKLWRVGE
jgi:hypothetical protein